MCSVKDPEEAARWWAASLGVDEVHLREGRARVRIGGIDLGFHPAGPQQDEVTDSLIVYFAVDDLEGVRVCSPDACRTQWRGPTRIDQGRRKRQAWDPLGTVFGLRGSCPAAGVGA